MPLNSDFDSLSDEGLLVDISSCSKVRNGDSEPPPPLGTNVTKIGKQQTEEMVN